MTIDENILLNKLNESSLDIYLSAKNESNFWISIMVYFNYFSKTYIDLHVLTDPALNDKLGNLIYFMNVIKIFQ